MRNQTGMTRLHLKFLQASFLLFCAFPAAACILVPADIPDNMMTLVDRLQNRVNVGNTIQWMGQITNKYGPYKFRVSEKVRKMVNAPHEHNDQMMKRIGAEDRPIWAHRIIGESGSPGATIIYNLGEKFESTDFDNYHGPPHTHLDDRVTWVHRGKGLFLMVREAKGKDVLVVTEAEEGDLFVIPAGATHTFWGGKDPFQVVAISSYNFDTDEEKFQDLVNAKTLKSYELLSYENYLDRFNQ